MKKILASLLLFIFIHESRAQTSTAGNKTFSFSFISNDFQTPNRIRTSSLSSVLRNHQVAKLKDMDHGFAVTYSNGVVPHIDLATTLGGSFTKRGLPGKTSFNSDFLLEADASARFKMFDKATVNPYLIAGIGGSKYRSYYGAFVPLGGGFLFNIFNETHVFAHLQYRIPVTTETNDYHFQVSFGIGGLLSEKKAPEVKVVPQAPPDTDGDGIVDSADACPTVAGLAKYRGCPIPDTDKDGINDEEDKCPQVAGVAKYGGCPVPDTDNDGINDDDDKCPTVAGVARYQGCPVPDTDSDGVNDEEDKCPTIVGTRANNGCPEVSKEVVTKMQYAAKRIFFVTGSAKLSVKSNAALNEVVKILNDDQNLKLSIEGHTDNVGKADFNKTLSDKRANSVKTYLQNKGIGESRLSAEGFGMEVPVADNKTAAGRAKNRRVELKLDY